ncbi:hypothetical protein HG15A2_23870 [Adhaeretor mobilis]|uniref:Uncharacterized protein n=1 Tax=Adhaeretor mobilis TaxID=1930276 RepID=A0A517MWB8_9BACT|nr:hypothetical protein HG15A2_23870 [Adhaeretor mobilis]
MDVQVRIEVVKAESSIKIVLTFSNKIRLTYILYLKLGLKSYLTVETFVSHSLKGKQIVQELFDSSPLTLPARHAP